MLAVKFDKNRQFDATSEEWSAFASRLHYKRVIQFHAAVHSDTKRVDSNLDVWSIRTAGELITFDFTRIDDGDTRLIVKWLIYKCLASYSVTVSKICFRLFVNRGWTLGDLALPAIYEKLELSRSEKDGYNINYFAAIKLVTNFFISNDAPGTEIEDLFELEQQTPGMSINVAGYYDMEVRLSPLEDQFIQMHTTHDAKFMMRLSYAELRDFVILRLCYEIGLRPIQLFRLSKDSFQSVNGQYFSILRPWAKKGRKNDYKKGTDRLAISPELGRVITELIARQNHYSVQLLQKEDGTDFIRNNGVTSINNTLIRWGADESHKTPYDFRHNMAHRMVMAGSSASEVAYMLGHDSLLAARHYIAASPSISALREKALARNGTYGAMVALHTGELALPDNWQEKEVLGRVGEDLATGIGGCDATDCEYVPVYNCYGCQNFHPFEDGNHDAVLAALRTEVLKIIVISDSTRQSGMNPAMTQLEGTMEQVKAVMSRCRNCRTCRGGQHAQ